MVFITFAIAFTIDQAKSVLLIYIIHVVIVRRFMHLSPNESEYLKPEILAIPKQENALPRL
jgi:hypothetical protein